MEGCDPVLSTRPTNTNLPDGGGKMVRQIRQSYENSSVPLFSLSFLQPRYAHRALEENFFEHKRTGRGFEDHPYPS